MNDWIILAATVLNLAVAVSAALRSRYWARRAENAATEAALAYYRAHDSAIEAENNASRAESAARKDTK